MNLDEMIEKERPMRELVKAYRSHYILPSARYEAVLSILRKFDLGKVKYIQIECNEFIRAYSFFDKFVGSISVVIAILTYVKDGLIDYCSAGVAEKMVRTVAILALAVILYWISMIKVEKYKYIKDVVEQYLEYNK